MNLSSLLRRPLFASRWLLVPLHIGLVLSLVAIVVKGAEKAVTFALTFWQQSEAATTVAILGFIDLTLTASLIVLVIFSSYENFIAPVSEDESHGWPRWMARIDFAGLKLKLMSSIVAISAVRLLEAFMNIEHETTTTLLFYVGIHLTFVVSSLVLALTERLGGEGHTAD